MKLTKLTLMALVLALVICALAACGGDTPAVTEGGDVAPNTEATPATDAETEPVDPATCQHTNVVEVVDEPTCEARGYKRTMCADCDEQLSVKPLDMIDHVAAAEATCTEGSVCKFCGTAMASATGHKVETYTDVKEATKTEAGYKKGKCASCGVEITEVIPAGITDNYDNFPVGAVTNEVLGANSALAPDFVVTVNKGESFEIVEDGNNKYIKKLGPDGQIYYAGEALNSKKVEITFDLRVDAEISGVKGLLSIWGDKEMRVLNLVNSTTIGFGINTAGILNFASYEVGQWVKIKVVLDTNTFDYEVYVNGEMMLATASDPENAGRHLLYVRENGEMVEKKDGEGYKSDIIHNGGDRSPFVLNGDSIKKIEFFHWTDNFSCSLDNLTIGFAN